MSGCLELRQSAGLDVDSVKNFYPARMGKCCRQTENGIHRLRFSLKRSAQGFSHARTYVAVAGAKPVFDLAAGTASLKQPARLKHSQILACQRERLAEAFGNGRHVLARMPQKEAENLQTGAIGDGAASPPERRLERNCDRHEHTLQSALMPVKTCDERRNYTRRRCGCTPGGEMLHFTLAYYENMRMKRLPLPTSLCTSTEPPCNIMMDFTMAKPRPAPSG
jgi:hypothetical protein